MSDRVGCEAAPEHGRRMTRTKPSSITDAYALIKLLNKEYGLVRFRVVANMVGNPKEVIK